MTADSLKKLKHELRTPINHIIGYSELLMESATEDGSEGMARLAFTIRDTGQNLASIIDRHLLAPPNKIGPAEMAVLHDDVVVVLDDLLAKRPQADQAPRLNSYSDDLAKIYAATEHLKSAMQSELTLIHSGE